MSDWNGSRTLLDVLAECLGDEAWMDDANCIGEDPAIFHSDDEETISAALDICSECPVRAQCLSYGEGQKFGVWGGEDKTARRQWRPKDSCSKGHPFDEENTGRSSRGQRRCRACDREWHAARRAKRENQENAA